VTVTVLPPREEEAKSIATEKPLTEYPLVKATALPCLLYAYLPGGIVPRTTHTYRGNSLDSTLPSYIIQASWRKRRIVVLARNLADVMYGNLGRL